MSEGVWVGEELELEGVPTHGKINQREIQLRDMGEEQRPMTTMQGTS